MYTKKKILALLLAVLMLAAMVPSLAFAANETVVVSPQKLAVDGKAIDVFASYNINNENYLKIRDVALLLKGTSAEFSADYANGTVTIKTNSTYVSDGSESKAKPTEVKNFYGASNDKVSIDGKSVDFTVYKIDNSNYFRLKDFAAVGAIVTFDTATSTAKITTVPSETVTLTIRAATSLTAAMNEIKTNYEAKYSNVTLEFTFGSSGSLVSQIKEEVAPSDLFFSADEKNMDALGDLVGTRVNLLRNDLVLIVPKGNPKGITSFEDVLTKADTIAIGDHSTPAGDYAREVFATLGLTDALAAKGPIECINVGAVRTAVEENADAGFVYRTDAVASDKVEIVTVAPVGSHTPIIYPGAVLSDSKNQAAANAFLEYLSSDAAKAVFTAKSFTPNT